MKANHILDTMWVKYHTNGGDLQQVKPNAWTYNSVLHCWCAAGNMTRAEELLLELEQGSEENNLAPTISSYTTV